LRAILRLRVGRESVRAELVRRGRVLWAGETTIEGPEDLQEAVAQLAAEPGLPSRPSRLTVEVDTPVVQLRTLEGLPPVRESTLPLLVGNQAGRFFRRNGKPLVIDARWKRRLKGEPRVAQAAAVEEPWIEAVLAGARTAGLELETISPPAPSPLTLLSPAERGRRRRAALTSLRRLTILVAGLWICVGCLAAARLEREERRIETRLSEIGEAVDAVRGARRQIGEAATMLQTVAAAERARGTILIQLGQVTAALPDSAFLESLTVDEKGAGSISGLARSAVALVERLDRASGVTGPTLDGPAVRERHGTTEWERFSVRFGGRGRS
jgi:hypothetical protein